MKKTCLDLVECNKCTSQSLWHRSAHIIIWTDFKAHAIVSGYITGLRYGWTTNLRKIKILFST